MYSSDALRSAFTGPCRKFCTEFRCLSGHLPACLFACPPVPPSLPLPLPLPRTSFSRLCLWICRNVVATNIGPIMTVVAFSGERLWPLAKDSSRIDAQKVFGVATSHLKALTHGAHAQESESPKEAQPQTPDRHRSSSLSRRRERRRRRDSAGVGHATGRWHLLPG